MPNLTFRISPSCGGALLTQTYVITAAHCLADASAEYYVLLNDYSTSENSSVQVESEIEGKLIHPDFKPSGDGLFLNDVALVQLSSPASSKFNSYICLPDPGKLED